MMDYDDKIELIEEMLEDLTDWEGTDKSMTISLLKYNFIFNQDRDMIIASWEDRYGEFSFVIQELQKDYLWEEWIEQAASDPVYGNWTQEQIAEYPMTQRILALWNAGWEVIDWDTGLMSIDEFIIELEKIHQPYQSPF